MTSPDDLATRRVCDFWNVRCVKTTAFTEGGPFCKAAGINQGLAALRQDGWVVHMDADVVLPPKARQVLRRAEPDERCIYGIDRLLVRGFAEWADFLSNPQPMHELDVFVHSQPFPVGTRIAKDAHGGYLPIGYFQMWHPGTSGVRQYPEGHTDAARSDMLFAIQWPRPRRAMLPDLYCYHLESERAPMGVNWKGRVTRWFAPDPRFPWDRRPPEPLPTATARGDGGHYGDTKADEPRAGG